MSKKILISLSVIAVAAAIAIGGTVAYFSDTETVSVGDINAGNLNLQVGDVDPCIEHVTIPDIAPGWGKRLAWKLTNTGSLDGELSVEIGPITNKENGQNEPEAAVDPSPGDLEGELGDEIIVGKVGMLDPLVRLYGRRADGTEYKYSWKDDLNELGERTLYAPIGSSRGILNPGESETVYLDLRLESTVGNWVQSDSVEFDIVFHLEQVQ